jgi:hypothetical protein
VEEKTKGGNATPESGCKGNAFSTTYKITAVGL